MLLGGVVVRMYWALMIFRNCRLQTSMQTSMGFGGSRFISMETNIRPWKLPWKSVEVYLLPWKIGGSRFTSMEISGSFHGNAWTFPVSVEVESSIASVNCSFHERIPWKLP